MSPASLGRGFSRADLVGLRQRTPTGGATVTGAAKTAGFSLRRGSFGGLGKSERRDVVASGTSLGPTVSDEEIGFLASYTSAARESGRATLEMTGDDAVDGGSGSLVAVVPGGFLSWISGCRR